VVGFAGIVEEVPASQDAGNGEIGPSKKKKKKKKKKEKRSAKDKRPFPSFPEFPYLADLPFGRDT
jgi:hypothetical protein